MQKEYSMKVKGQELKFTVDEWKCIYKTLQKYIPEIEENFYDSIVSNLKKEAMKLNERLTKLRENQNVNNDYIANLKSLRETLDLISKYDWQLMYSEYDTKHNENDEWHKHVSVWEQNHENQIRNHKVWTILKDMSDITRDTSLEIGKSLKDINIKL